MSVYGTHGLRSFPLSQRHNTKSFETDKLYTNILKTAKVESTIANNHLAGAELSNMSDLRAASYLRLGDSSVQHSCISVTQYSSTHLVYHFCI